MSVNTTQLFARFDHEMRGYFTQTLPASLGVAVSGGSDSLALLFLAKQWCAGHGIECRAVTVDHDLRPTSRQEAEWVVQVAANLGIACDIKTWAHDDPKANLQAQARTARYGLIDAWRHDISHVLTGHTLDDQAETFLLRLKRGSGVDGLSAMASVRDMGDWSILRPCLNMTRQDLRAFLMEHSQTWIEDPSNDNPKFDRVRMRHMLNDMRDAGLDAKGLADTSTRMARARDALQFYTKQLARTSVTTEYGDVIIDLNDLNAAPDDIQFRLVAAAIGWITSQTYRPRFSALKNGLEAVKNGQAATLAGAVLFPHKGHLRATREYNAIKEMTGCGQFDHRWAIEHESDHHIAALGPDHATTLEKHIRKAIPHRTLIVQPAIFKGNLLISVPTLLDQSQKGATFCSQDFFHSLFRH